MAADDILNAVSSPEARLLALGLKGVKEDVTEIKGDVKSMALAVNTLISIERKQADQDTVQRDHENRIKRLEITAPGLIEMRLWIVGGFALLAGLVATALFTGHLGFVW